MDPGAMQQMMQSPLMQQLLNNPELLRGMLQANPAVRQVRRAARSAAAPQRRVALPRPSLGAPCEKVDACTACRACLRVCS